MNWLYILLNLEYKERHKKWIQIVVYLRLSLQLMLICWFFFDRNNNQYLKTKMEMSLKDTQWL